MIINGLGKCNKKGCTSTFHVSGPPTMNMSIRDLARIRRIVPPVIKCRNHVNMTAEKQMALWLCAEKIMPSSPAFNPGLYSDGITKIPKIGDHLISIPRGVFRSDLNEFRTEILNPVCMTHEQDPRYSSS